MKLTSIEMGGGVAQHEDFQGGGKALEILCLL
jgi:hypothetical protein